MCARARVGRPVRTRVRTLVRGRARVKLRASGEASEQETLRAPVKSNQVGGAFQQKGARLQAHLAIPPLKILQDSFIVPDEGTSEHVN